MTTSGQADLHQALRDRRETIAQRWQQAIGQTSFVPFGVPEVRQRLVELTDQAITALLDGDSPRREAERIGASLARLHYTRPEALSQTQEVLGAQLLAGLPARRMATLQPRLTALLAGIAAGFVRQVQETTLAEQETIRSALLTQRQRAQEALRRSEERFRAIFQEAGIGIGLADLEGRILTTNPAWLSMLGYEPGELMGQFFSDLIHPDDRAHNWTLFQEMVAGTREQFAMEQRLCRKDGDLVWCHLIVSLVRDAAGRPEFTVGMGENITERKQAEAALVEQYQAAERARGETRAVLDATNEGIALVAPDQRFLSVNQRFCDLFGVQPERVVGKRFAELAEQVDQVFADPAVFRTQVGAGADDWEHAFQEIVQQRWPERRELELYSTPVHSGAGLLGRLYAFRDVTRERAVDRMKSEFISLVSHELRTPLTSIKGYVDLLLDGDVGALLPEQAEFLGIVKNNADRLVALINDLLDISRIEAGSVELRRAPLDLARLVGEVVASVRPALEHKGQQLVLDLPANLPAVWADADRLVQVLTNLVSNAHKYTPAGGTITLQARATGDAETGPIELVVADTGIGLSPAEQSQLFTKFFRARNRATAEAGGTGLGLAITRSLVELHGGTISVDSAPGEGARFTVRLPRAPQPLSEREREREVLPAPGQARGRVLVVDDEPDIAALLRRYLERAGFQVQVAHQASAALELARSTPPDLITLDLRMPDADGFTALEWLKADPKTASIPVLLVSVLEDNGEGQRLGAVDYLVKPVGEEILLAHVGALLPRQPEQWLLVAEDEPDQRRLLVHFLRAAGYRVLEAADGAEALELCEAQQPALALLDVRMPRLDGLAALAAMRQDPRTATLPVIMLTASPGALEATAAQAERLGIAALLGKPFTAEALTQAIARLLQ